MFRHRILNLTIPCPHCGTEDTKAYADYSLPNDMTWHKCNKCATTYHHRER